MTLAWSYVRALEAIGHEVTTFDPMARLNRSSLWRSRIIRRPFEREILRHIGRTMLSDMLSLGTFDAVVIFKGAWIVPEFLRIYKSNRPTTLLACYNADDPITTWSRGANRPWVTDAISCYDLYITYNQALTEPILNAGPGAVMRLPFAWDPVIHPNQEFDDSADVVFVGNSDRYREKWLTELVEHPLACDWRIKVYGDWHNVTSPRLKQVIQSEKIVGVDMARITAGARISLNILREQNVGSHNMRTFETPGSGGVLASQFSDEQDSFFPNGKAAIYFETPRNIATTLSPYLADLNRLAALRSASRERVQVETYRDRAGLLVDKLRELQT